MADAGAPDDGILGGVAPVEHDARVVLGAGKGPGHDGLVHGAQPPLRYVPLPRVDVKAAAPEQALPELHRKQAEKDELDEDERDDVPYEREHGEDEEEQQSQLGEARYGTERTQYARGAERIECAAGEAGDEVEDTREDEEEVDLPTRQHSVCTRGR